MIYVCVTLQRKSVTESSCDVIVNDDGFEGPTAESLELQHLGLRSWCEPRAPSCREIFSLTDAVLSSCVQADERAGDTP